AITSLDPDWDFPYHFAGIVLGNEANMVDRANAIIKKGMERESLSHIWQFPFYMGFNFFHLKKDPRCGAHFMFLASQYPDSPSYLKPLAARLSSQGNSPENH